MKRWTFFTLAAAAVLFSIGCTTLDHQQRTWIFQPSDRAWGGSASEAEGMDEVWIPFDSKVTGEPSKLNALWLAADKPRADTPILLYLHGARWNVAGSSGRIRRMQELGFSVLAIDYRGFGKSTAGLPSEDTAYEDAHAAWDWLAAKYPGHPRYIFGHSLGGAVAIDLASRVDDEKGTIVEGTFTSIADVASSMKWGWLPVGALITQRFDSASKVAKIGSPLLVVHGDSDSTIDSALGRKLFDAAPGKKAFLLIEGGSHFSTMSVGRARYREAIAQLFSLR
jgi:alpha-beta hydrolase superfamily lysophospholipase